MDAREMMIRICAFLVFGGMLFMLGYITFLVIRGSMNGAGAKPSGPTHPSVGDEHASRLLTDEKQREGQ